MFASIRFYKHSLGIADTCIAAKIIVRHKQTGSINAPKKRNPEILYNYDSIPVDLDYSLNLLLVVS